jgi:biotin transporter BioY
VNRLALAIGLFVLVLSACAPQAQVENNVVPTLFSTSVRGDTVVLQGRYLGDGQGGEASGSYVLLGANYNGSGGVRAPVLSWTTNRIEVSVPSGAGYGYGFVFVDRLRSNGLPVDLN